MVDVGSQLTCNLSKTEIEVTYINTDSTDLREAEADENVVRKDFSVEEIAEIDEFYREREEVAAKATTESR